jgi:hypothetical protein
MMKERLALQVWPRKPAQAGGCWRHRRVDQGSDRCTCRCYDNCKEVYAPPTKKCQNKQKMSVLSSGANTIFLTPPRFALR